MASSDATAVEAAVREYIDSWYRGDADGMARALHPELVKRSVTVDEDDGSLGLAEVTRRQMVDATAGGGGDAPDTPVEVVVHDVEGDIASARVGTPHYLDYVHLARTADGWRIVDDLYRPRDA